MPVRMKPEEPDEERRETLHLRGQIEALQAQVGILDAQRARLGRLAETMNAMALLSTQINVLDADRIKDLCVTRVPPLAKAREAAYFGLDEASHRLVLERHSDAGLVGAVPSVAPGEDSLLDRALQSHDIVVVNSLPGFAAALGTPLRLHPALAGARRCCLLSPLRTSQGLVGVLVLMDKEDGTPFDVVNDVPPVSQVSQLLAAALRNFQLYELVMRQSRTDSLTGLLNRRALGEVLDRELSRCARYGHPLAVLLIDVDRFKQINDTRGHAEGDTVLMGMAELLSRQVRTVDVVARHGGDEFCVVLPETDAAGARIVASRFLEGARAWRTPGGTGVTCSIGIATAAKGATAVPLLAEADRALYAVKAKGRDGLAVAGEG